MAKKKSSKTGTALAVLAQPIRESRKPQETHQESSQEQPQVADAEFSEIPAAEFVDKTTEVELGAEVARLRKFNKHIQDANRVVQKLTQERQLADAKVVEAKGAAKKVQGQLDKAVAELTRVISDSKAGQAQLPFDEPPKESVKATAEKQPVQDKIIDGEQIYPLSDLSIKSIRSIVGDDEFNRAKDTDDPIGLSDAVLEKIAQSGKNEIKSVQDLEQWMREDAYWHQKIAGVGEKGIQRIVSTLTAFRRVKPMA